MLDRHATLLSFVFYLGGGVTGCGGTDDIEDARGVGVGDSFVGGGNRPGDLGFSRGSWKLRRA